MTILAHLNHDGDQAAANSIYCGQTSYQELKKAVVVAVNQHLEPIRQKLSQIKTSDLLEKVEKNEEKLRPIAANGCLKEFQQAIGLKVGQGG